ncbi:hypothetical protein SAMN05192549_1112 [Duganella sacchari]|uniref:Uncharacterized protein n=1 Tax=Duganella sacchari TaxID=551987 RepID=A0A1M7R536_9BURK|nr:hypothetical protein SAMN05192549_1112 [Duganella sacchari]
MKHVDQTTLAAAKDLLESYKKQSQSPVRQKNLDLLWPRWPVKFPHLWPPQIPPPSDRIAAL